MLHHLKKLKSSFLYRFTVCFILMVIVPFLCICFLYQYLINDNYTKNMVKTQQLTMENASLMLESKIDVVQDIFKAVEANQEIKYYLEYNPVKNNMQFGEFVRIHNFCEELSIMSSYLKELKIYCTSPLAIYAAPFEILNDQNIDPAIIQELNECMVDSILWILVPQEGEKFPAVYAYKKLYTKNYLKCIGYMEVQLSPKLLEEHFQMVEELSSDKNSVLSMFDKQGLMSINYEGREWELLKDGYELQKQEDRYYNHVEITRLNICMTLKGKLSDLKVGLSDNPLSLFFFGALILLLGSLIVYFSMILALSKRILAFSSYIENVDPEKWYPFLDKKRRSGGKDELDGLIETFNTLMEEKGILTSKIQKMEQLTKEAKYLALQGQIHPHFLYGTLETIRMIALENKDRAAATMIFSLSMLLRYSFSISTKEVTLQEELEIARHYLEIQSVRLGERISYSFQVDEKLKNLELPSFILQPILENAISYGVSQSLDTCELRIEAYEKEATIVIRILNGGKLAAPERVDEVNLLLSGKIALSEFKGERNGHALYNIKERLRIFFEEQAEVLLGVTKDYTETCIRISGDAAKYKKEKQEG